MTFLLRTFITSVTLLLGLLLWWRPAPMLIEIRPIDWAKEYEAAHTPAEQMSGVMGHYREIIRSSKAHVALTEFIARETEGQFILGSSDEWRNWYSNLALPSLAEQQERFYCSADIPPFDGLDQERGYVEIHSDGRVDFLFFSKIPARYFVDLKIPSALRYPFRSEAAGVLLAAVALILFQRFRRGPTDLAANSSAGKGCKVFVVVLTTGFALFILPFFYQDFDSNIPLFFVGFFVLIAGFIGLGMFGWQLQILRQIIAGKDLLVHWQYDLEEWRRFVEWEFKEEREEKRGLWVFISAIVVLVGGGFWLIMRDRAAAWVFLFLLSLIPLLWMVAVLAPKLTYRRNMKGPGEVYIGAAGMYVNGSVHTWRLPGSRFESAEFLTQPFPLLAVVYSYLMIAGRSLYVFRQYAEVRAPVPAGKEEEARSIAESLQTNRQSKRSAAASPASGGAGKK